MFNWRRRDRDRRREPRKRAGNLAVYYWTGNVPSPRRVRDIGVSGAYILAPEQFYPGTLIQMALVDQSRTDPGPDSRMFVCARAVERREDGFSVVFPFMDRKERRHMRVFLDQVPAVDPSQPVEAANGGAPASDAAPEPFAGEPGAAPVTPPASDDLPDLGFRSTQPRYTAEPDRVPPQGAGPKAPDNAGGPRAANGQALIEFALILPLLLLLIVNVINFGMFIYDWISVSNAARTGVQYLSQGGAMVGAPGAPTLPEVQTLVMNDLASLPNGSTAVVRVCRVDGVLSCIGAGSQTPPAETSEPGPGGTTVTYSPGSVDVTYTYSPLIPLWDFPALGIHATLPRTSIHRQAAMRTLQ